MKIEEDKWYAHRIEDEFQNNNELQIYLPRGKKSVTKRSEPSFAEKHPIIANILQAELAVAGLIVSWFLVTFFYHIGYFIKWEIPMQFMEIDLIAGAKLPVILTYIFLMLIAMVIYRLKVNLPLEILFFIGIIIYKLLGTLYDIWMHGWNVTAILRVFSTPKSFDPIAISGFIVIYSFYFFVKLIFRMNKIGFMDIVMCVFSLSILVPLAVGYSVNTSFSWPVIYKNGKITNQVIVSTYRDYFLVGYYKGNTLYPCYRLVKMVEEDKLNETEVAPKSQKKAFKYSEDRYQITDRYVLYDLDSPEKGCPNF